MVFLLGGLSFLWRKLRESLPLIMSAEHDTMRKAEKGGIVAMRLASHRATDIYHFDRRTNFSARVGKGAPDPPELAQWCSDQPLLPTLFYLILPCQVLLRACSPRDYRTLNSGRSSPYGLMRCVTPSGSIRLLQVTHASHVFYKVQFQLLTPIPT